MENCEYAIEGATEETESVMESLFVPIKAEPVFEGASEETTVEENLEATENADDIENCDYAIKRDSEETEAVMESLFVPIKAEPAFEGMSEETTKEEDKNSSERAVKSDADDGGALNDPVFVSIKPEPDFQETSHETIMWGNLKATESTENMESTRCQMKRELDDAESLMSPLFVSTESEPDFKMTSEESTVEENFEASESAEEFFKENNERHFMKYASIQPLSVEMPAHQEHSLINSTSEHLPNSLPSLNCQKLFVVPSCSAKGPIEVQKQLSTKSKFRRCTSHEEKVHSGSLKSSTVKRCFKCNECGKEFKKKSDLARHIWIHTGDRPYKCPQCGKSFVQRSHLSYHMHIHSGERPYECSECGKSFKLKGNLTNHMRIHTGEKPYKCYHCGRSFSQHFSLTVHMQTHSGDRPYKCSQCGKSFTTNSNLTKHERKHKRDQP